MGPRELKLQHKLEMGRGPAGESKELKITKRGPLIRSMEPTEVGTVEELLVQQGPAALFGGLWGRQKKLQKYNDYGISKLRW